MHIRQILDDLLQRRRLWRVLFTLSLILIIWLAFTSEPYPMPSAPSDKLNHLIAFAELALLARLGWPSVRAAVLVLALLVFGLGLELGQALTPWRQFSLLDLSADALGLAVGLALAHLLQRSRPVADTTQ